MTQKQQANLGRTQLISQLIRRISRHYDPKVRTIDRSLVVGIFGEWGSGKSWVLQQLLSHFTAQMTQDKQARKKQKKAKLADTQPDSNKEVEKTQLVVPILFNPWRFEAEEHLIIPLLMTVHDELTRLGKTHESLKEGAEHFWQSALAFAAAWKFKLGICTFEPDKALKAQDRMQEKEHKKIADLNSYYYNFESKLKELSDKGLNFLFLIDDIDRCLPERSVQMLEAIKLFLDVPGCVFVLGVDDEVVERGIRYRYRDYNHNSDDPKDTMPLITGMEYLEKIIHLPIRLPLMQESQVRAFLKEKYPDLFLSKSGEKNLAEDDLTQELLTGRENPQADALLDLFVHAVPPIPRKLIRAAELLSFLCDMPLHFQPDRLMLARLSLLQLFAPGVFRHLRRVNPELVRVIAGWQEDNLFSLSKLNEIKKEKGSDIDVWQIEEQPLIKEILKAADNRNNFDPCGVFKGLVIPSGLSLTDHIHLIGERIIIADQLPTPDNVAELAAPETFLQDLFNKREATWRKACDDDQLRGKVLDNDLFQEIIKRLDKKKEFLENHVWLETLSRRLAQTQLDLLNDKFNLRANLLQQMMNPDEGEIQQRAQAGRTLGLLGDPRDGVTVQKDNPALPDIDWVQIPAGTFQMGSDDEQAADDEKPVHEVTVPGFSMSRFLVTNAQYRCFVEAGGYSQNKYWQAAGAMQWKEKKEAKEENLVPAYWQDRQWNIANHPVVGVSWFEAVAFCVWLSEFTGKKIRLPGEEEWEYAARGSENLLYAWGNRFDPIKGNTSETDLQQTSAVGLFPAGKAFGLSDMTGNVWEWTAGCYNDKSQYKNWDTSKQGKAERENLNEKGSRVIRGGSWLDFAVNARCSIRFRDHPVFRDLNLGFRVVFSLA